MNIKLQQKNHLPTFDLLRYLCAVLILIWHYQHFFLLNPNKKTLNFKVEDQPFWNLLNTPYKAGFTAVNIFWILSGVVLSKSYFSIDPKLKNFFVNRFARLYPLHIATLVLVLIIQFFSNLLVGHPQIYEKNSLSQFFGNLFLMNNGMSFNAVIWSVSVEIFSYIVFSALIILKTFRYVFCFGILVMFFVLSQTQLPHLSFLQTNQISQCGIYFFCGVFSIFLAEKIPVPILTILAISFTLYGLQVRSSTHLILIIGIILSCLMLESFVCYGKRLQRIFQTLGNLSYTTYLIHVPSQMILLIYFQKVEIDQSILAANGIFFIFWFLTIHVASFVIYKYFEIPSKIWIKKFVI